MLCRLEGLRKMTMLLSATMRPARAVAFLNQGHDGRPGIIISAQANGGLTGGSAQKRPGDP